MALGVGGGWWQLMTAQLVLDNSVIKEKFSIQLKHFYFACTQTFWDVTLCCRLLKDHSAFIFNDQAVYLDSFTLHMKALWFFKTLGITNPVTQWYSVVPQKTWILHIAVCYTNCNSPYSYSQYSVAENKTYHSLHSTKTPLKWHMWRDATAYCTFLQVCIIHLTSLPIHKQYHDTDSIMPGSNLKTQNFLVIWEQTYIQWN